MVGDLGSIFFSQRVTQKLGKLRATSVEMMHGYVESLEILKNVGEGRIQRKFLIQEAKASLLFFWVFLAMPCSMRDLSSLTRDQTCAPCIGSAES